MDLLDTHSQIEVQSTVSALSSDTAIVSPVIDLQGFDSCEFIIATSTLADANATFAVTVAEGDTSSPATNVPDGDKLYGSLPSFTFALDNSNVKVGYRGEKRYVQLTVTPSGNTGTGEVAIICIKRKKKVGSI